MPHDLKLGLELVASNDIAGLVKAEKNYGYSWRKRGGVGAFMMLARKWDRLEIALRDREHANDSDETPQWKDLFTVIRNDTRAEGIMDDIRDLRRYLLLVEEYMAQQGVVAPEVQK